MADPATLLDGDALAMRLRSEMVERVADLRARGGVPKLATVLVGEDAASAAYIARKHQDCAALDIEAENIRLSVDTTQADLSATIGRLNRDPAIQGLLVQLPLPDHLDAARVLEELDPSKDIDGLHPLNLGRLVAGVPGIRPCTPAAVLTLLEHHRVPLAGRHVAILGRGTLVGRPLAMLLGARGIDASVTLLHARSIDTARLTRQADVVVAAVGRPGLVTADMVRPGAAVVGVGISYDGYDGESRMVSDIAEDVGTVASWVTPPHGSVGALTRAMLLRNLLDLAEIGLPSEGPVPPPRRAPAA